MAIIGIDLGTTNSLAAVWKNGKPVLIPNSLGEFLTPSAVSIDENNNIIVGRAAKERLVSDPDKTAASFKCFMGTNKKIRLGKKEFTPPELSSFILRRIKEDAEVFLGEKVEEAVISVPAYFNDNGRNATKLAGELAGLKVERIINEPSAAALAYKLDSSDEDAFLIFDFGGGTLDISIVDIFDSIIEIISVAGDNHLGGDDFNMAIAQAFCTENNIDFNLLEEETKAVLLKQSEQCKIALSSQPKAVMMLNIGEKSYSFLLDNQKLLTISAVLFKRIEEPVSRAIRDAGMYPDNISDIILVGGSSHMPLVRKWLEKLFGREINLSISPDTAVARGVGIAAGIKERNAEIKDMILTDICPFTLGIGQYNENDPENSRFFPMIERNTTLPATYEHVFSTVDKNQKEVTIRIAQGEKLYFKSNLYLGELSLRVPAAPAGQEKIKVRFTYDINGILQVEVTSTSTGETVSKVILNESCRLSEKQLKNKLRELEKIKINPRETDEVKLLLARGERLYEENIGSARSYISDAINYFNAALISQDARKIRHAERRFKDFLDKMEFGSSDMFFSFYEDSEEE